MRPLSEFYFIYDIHKSTGIHHDIIQTKYLKEPLQRFNKYVILISNEIKTHVLIFSMCIHIPFSEVIIDNLFTHNNLVKNARIGY